MVAEGHEEAEAGERPADIWEDAVVLAYLREGKLPEGRQRQRQGEAPSWQVSV